MEIFSLIYCYYFVCIHIYMNDYLYYNVKNRYYFHLLDTYHIPFLAIASYY